MTGFRRPSIPSRWERRSAANMVEVLIRDYCGRSGITNQESQALFPDENRKPHLSER